MANAPTRISKMKIFSFAFEVAKWSTLVNRDGEYLFFKNEEKREVLLSDIGLRV